MKVFWVASETLHGVPFIHVWESKDANALMWGSICGNGPVERKELVVIDLPMNGGYVPCGKCGTP